jgi:hypothetical protein
LIKKKKKNKNKNKNKTKIKKKVNMSHFKIATKGETFDDRIKESIETLEKFKANYSRLMEGRGGAEKMTVLITRGVYDLVLPDFVKEQSNGFSNDQLYAQIDCIAGSNIVTGLFSDLIHTGVKSLNVGCFGSISSNCKAEDQPEFTYKGESLVGSLSFNDNIYYFTFALLSED